jgi:hypothetical protein
MGGNVSFEKVEPMKEFIHQKSVPDFDPNQEIQLYKDKHKISAKPDPILGLMKIKLLQELSAKNRKEERFTPIFRKFINMIDSFDGRTGCRPCDVVIESGCPRYLPPVVVNCKNASGSIVRVGVTLDANILFGIGNFVILPEDLYLECVHMAENGKAVDINSKNIQDRARYYLDLSEVQNAAYYQRCILKRLLAEDSNIYKCPEIKIGNLLLDPYLGLKLEELQNISMPINSVEPEFMLHTMEMTDMLKFEDKKLEVKKFGEIFGDKKPKVKKIGEIFGDKKPEVKKIESNPEDKKSEVKKIESNPEDKKSEVKKIETESNISEKVKLIGETDNIRKRK